jgi:hypothetical protein
MRTKLRIEFQIKRKYNIWVPNLELSSKNIIYVNLNWVPNQKKIKFLQKN